MSEAAESAINAPHVNEEGDNNGLDFFGAEAGGDLTIDPTGAELPEAESIEQLAEGATVTVDGAEVPGTIETKELLPEGEQPPDPVEAAKSGTTERGYVILQEITLTKEALEEMLKGLAQGQAPAAALFEIERIQARNHKDAFGKTWKNNDYGNEARLAAVTERAMDVKTIKPKVVTTNALEIS